MILTCHDCPRQISFPGSRRDVFAGLFGWSASSGKYRCASCAAEQNGNGGNHGATDRLCGHEPEPSAA